MVMELVIMILAGLMAFGLLVAHAGQQRQLLQEQLVQAQLLVQTKFERELEQLEALHRKMVQETIETNIRIKSEAEARTKQLQEQRRRVVSIDGGIYNEEDLEPLL